MRCLMLLALFGLLLSSIRGYAQGSLCDSCPPVPTDDAQHGVATPAWNGGSKDYMITVNGHSCTVSICYACRQTSPTNFDYTITQFCVDSACFISFGISLDSLRTLALRAVFFDNPCGFPCPACPNADIEWQENQITCWRTIIIYNPFTGQRRIIHIACPTHGWCLNAYSVCCDANGVKHFTYKRSVNVSSTCGTGCTEITGCPPHF
jgi:hypothetical protein